MGENDLRITNCEVNFVSDLISTGTKTWNLEVVESLFMYFEAQYITQIPLS